MARSVNKVILVGRVGRDPEMRFTQAGTAVGSFTVATSRYRSGGQEGTVEETEWHNIVVWDKLADFCSQYVAKGRLVYIEGRLQTRSWDQDGVKRYKTEIIAGEVNLLDSKQEGGVPAGNGNGSGYANGNGNGNGSYGNGRGEPALAMAQDDDDLPF